MKAAYVADPSPSDRSLASSHSGQVGSQEVRCCLQRRRGGGYDGLRKTWPLSGGSRCFCKRIAGDVDGVWWMVFGVCKVLGRKSQGFRVATRVVVKQAEACPWWKAWEVLQVALRRWRNATQGW